MNRTIRNGIAVAALAGAGLAAAAVPSFAAGNPSSSAQATVTVSESITFAFNGPAAFSLAPNVTSHNAIGFNVATNDGLGYTVSLSAPDPATAGGGNFAASFLSYMTKDSGGGQVGQTQQLSNTPAVVFSQSHASGGTGDNYTQDWTAGLPANTPPGVYQSTLTYVATAN